MFIILTSKGCVRDIDVYSCLTIYDRLSFRRNNFKHYEVQGTKCFNLVQSYEKELDLIFYAVGDIF